MTALKSGSPVISASMAGVAVEHHGQPSMPHHHFDETADGHGAALLRVGKRVGDLDDPRDVLDARPDHFQGNAFLGLELVVDRSLADPPHPVGDHLQRRAVHPPMLGEEGHRGVEHPLASQASRCYGFRQCLAFVIVPSGRMSPTWRSLRPWRTVSRHNALIQVELAVRLAQLRRAPYCLTR